MCEIETAAEVPLSEIPVRVRLGMQRVLHLAMEHDLTLMILISDDQTCITRPCHTCLDCAKFGLLQDAMLPLLFELETIGPFSRYPLMISSSHIHVFGAQYQVSSCALVHDF